MRNYDDWKTSQEEVRPAAVCDCCGGYLYEGEYIYTVDGEELCLDCLKDNYRRLL